VPNHCPVWQKYEFHVLNPFSSTRQKLVALGVDVYDDLTLHQFGTSFKGNYSVVILFSHWRDDGIEFSDRVFKSPEVAEQISPDFEGILDLCVCHPTAFVTRIKKEKPSCLVRFTNHQATPALWLYFYRALFQLLDKGAYNYLDALEKTVESFLGNNSTAQHR
jgi:hypothetical protein